MSVSVDQLLENVSRDIDRLKAELDDAERFRRSLLKYMPNESEAAPLKRRIIRPARQVTPAANITKKSRIIDMVTQMIQSHGPMTSRALLTAFDQSGQGELVTGPTFDARLSTLSSILSRGKEHFKSDRTRGGYYLANEEPLQGASLEGAGKKSNRH